LVKSSLDGMGIGLSYAEVILIKPRFCF